MATIYELQLVDAKNAPEWLKNTLPQRYPNKLQAQQAQKKIAGLKGVQTKIVMIR